jgi:hypothetical protein
MSEPTFDPAQALKIDLSRGQLTLLGSSGRFLVPVDGLIDLLAACSPEAICAFGAGMGTDIGRRIVDRLGSAIERASVELYIEHLAGELALAGLGSLSVERWGKALVLRVEGLRDAEPLESVMISLIEAAIQRSLSRDVAVMRISKERGDLRLLILGRHAQSRVEQWLTEGLSYGDVLIKLHQGAGPDTVNAGGGS